MSALLEAIRQHAAADPARIAIDPAVGDTLAYAALAERVAALAASLDSQWDHARPIALQMDHGVDEAVWELALLEAGIPVLSLPSFYTADQTRHAIAASGAQAIVTSGEPTACDSQVVALPQGTARVTFTSGSTGTPKGVCLSADHLISSARAVVETVGACHAGRHGALMPSGILLETVAGFFATMLAGGTYVAPPQALVGLDDPFRPDFAILAHAVARLGITSLILVPEYLAGLVGAMERLELRLPQLTLVAVGGARTPAALIERARALGLPVRQGYGLTECGSVVALQESESDMAGPVGTTLGHVRISLASDGEVLVEGPLCLGTIGGEPPASPFATGDIGRIDADGQLWIEGRKSSLIVTSYGRNIAPEWLEEALVAQPEIIQVMAYGDGQPAPEALLVPASPGADLAAAVDRANRTLPDYAKIAQWREVAHFTPANGLLTGNGRLRRKAIAARHLDATPDFFTRLEDATVRERIAFLSIPQVQAGLAGTISRDAYIDYLTQAFHHVSHTVPLMQAARAGLTHRPELVEALDEYIEEETGHEEWILSDIAAAGGDAEAARHSQPHPATKAMVDHAYRTIDEDNPVSFFGMVYVLESISVALASRGASAVAEKLGLPPEAFTYLTSHGALDQSHMRFFAKLVNSLPDEADRDAITAMARAMFGLFGGVFASIELEPEHVAA